MQETDVGGNNGKVDCVSRVNGKAESEVEVEIDITDCATTEIGIIPEKESKVKWAQGSCPFLPCYYLRILSEAVRGLIFFLSERSSRTDFQDLSCVNIEVVTI